MANRNNQYIDSSVFKEYAYRVLKNTSAKQRENYTHEENAIFSTDYSLQKFCKEERIDRLMYLLSKAGVSWTLRLDMDSFGADMVEFNTQDQHLYPQKKVDVIEATAREGMCVISGRDVMNWSHMVAQNCASKVFAISEFNQAMVKAGKDFQALKNWDKQLGRAQESHDLFNELMLEQMNAFVNGETTFGLDINDLRVLSALYKRRQSSITMAEISNLAKSTGKKRYFRPELEKLLEQGLVMSDIKKLKSTWPNSSYFTITAKGIDKIIGYRNYILKGFFEKK